MSNNSKTANGILSRMLQNMPAEYNKEVGGFVYDILKPVATELENEYKEIDANMRRILIATAEGDDLDAALEELGYKRKKATFASGYVTVSGSVGATVPAGALVAKGKCVYIIQEAAKLTDGTATVPIKAQEAGSASNAEVGTVNYFPVTLENIISVTNTEKITGGTDKESDGDYRERYYYFLDHPVTSGNIYEYEQWAREIDGVGLAKCYKLWNGPGTVKVVITSAALEPALPKLVEAVYNHIEEQRVVGPTVTVVSAELIALNISADVVLNDGYLLSDVQEEFKAALTAYFKNLGFSGGLIPYTEIGSLLQEREGVYYYSNLLINDSTDNLQIADGTLVGLGEVVLNG